MSLLQPGSTGQLRLFRSWSKLNDNRTFTVEVSRILAIGSSSGRVAGQLHVEVLRSFYGEDTDLTVAGNIGEDHSWLFSLR